jgi:DNA polymerase I
VPGLDGRRIWVRSEHAALNSLLQGAGAIVMKKALVLAYYRLKKEKVWFKLVASVHDEYQFETKPEFADTLGNIVRESIIEAGKQFNLRCPLDGEYKTGKSWRHTH